LVGGSGIGPGTGARLSAGLLVRSFNQLLAIDLGFSKANVLTLRLALPRSKYPTPVQTINFHTQLMERLKGLPGVSSVGSITHTPLSGFGIIAYMGIENNGLLNAKRRSQLESAVSPRITSVR
jgi:hypothetical protein